MGRSKAIVLHPHQQQKNKVSEAVFRPSSIRIRRAILAGKRGPTTPVPSWKLYENPSYDGIIAGSDASGRQITISARKLAATLWELQELPLLSRALPQRSSSSSNAKAPSRLPPRSSRGPRQRDSTESPEPLMLPPPSPATPVPQNYVKPPSTKSSDSHRRSPYSDSINYHSRRASEEVFGETPPRNSFEVEHNPDEKAELMKVLSNISNQAGSAPLSVAVVRAELEHTRQRVRELELANKYARREMEALVERAETERASWRAKELEKCRAAVAAARQEAEEERRLKRKAEAANRKMERELSEVNAELSRARKELERERKARQLMEDVCDELAREIGHDKAEVEQLKLESEKVREEVEEERRMLQMAEVWREERVQMKLAEARHELEDKNATLDRLRAELEEFLSAKGCSNTANDDHQQEKAEHLRAAVDSLRKRNEEVGGTSAEEDLHSIDLNKESLFDRTQGNRWTYNRNSQGDSSAKGVWMNEKKAPEFRRKVFKARRRMRKQRVYDESQAADDDEQQREDSQGFENGNELEKGPNEGCSGEYHHHRAGASPGFRGGRRIDTIPEQQEELYQNSSSPKEAFEEDDEFALGFAQREGGNCRTPTLSPLLHSSASFPLSSVATPQRNSWSSGDLNPQLSKAIRSGSVEWPRIGSHAARDNSLRAKLLEAKLEDPHVYHHRKK